MSSSSRISDEKAVDLNHLNRLTAQINKLQNIRFEGQVEHLIKTDPDWQVVFDRIENKRVALEQIYQLVQEKRASLEQTKKELEALLHKQITHDKRRDATPSFRGFAQDAIFHHWLTFTDNAPEALSLVNVRFYNQVNDPMYWRLRLQRDFGMSPSYFSLITKNEDKITAVARMKMVHQRLSDVKKRHPSIYCVLYQPIIENGIEFPPLTATTIASLSEMDEGQVFFYLHEALRLQNEAVVENMLAMMLDDPARFSAGLQLCENRNSLSIVEKSKNVALLRKMAAISFGRFSNEAFEHRIQKMIRQNEQSLQSNDAGTLYLNELIISEQLQLAYELLQTGLVPDANTLMLVLELTQLRNRKQVPPDFMYYLLSLSKQYPQMLCQVWEHGDIVKYRGALYKILDNTTNTPLIQVVYDVLSSHLEEDDVSPVLTCLLKSMVVNGDWSQLKSHLESEMLLADHIELMSCALAHGQLPLLKELISLHQASTADDKQVDVIQYLLEELQLPISPATILSSAIGCGHLAVVKYFFDEAPQKMRQTPTAEVLSVAISHQKKDMVQYLVEDCGILPQKKHIEAAIALGSYDVSLYLIRLRSKMTLSLSDQTFNRLIGSGSRSPQAKNLLNWIAGPEGRKHGFQFNVNHFRVILNYNDLLPAPVPESMATSPEFLSLFQQLEDKEKNAFFTQISRAATYQSRLGNPMNIDRSTFSAFSVIVNNMKTDVDYQWFSLNHKIDLFVLALAYQDKALAKIFLNQENGFLYLPFSWDYIESQENLKYNAYQISPVMLAWLETELNIKIPDATLSAILNGYANFCQSHDVNKEAEAQHQQAIQDIYLTAFNKHRDFRFRDPQFTTIKMV
jgi:hypothetical protein